MFTDVTRRDFLSACSVLAGSLAACSNVTQRTRIAAAFLTDPALADYRRPLRALIRTVLPIGSPDFPLDVAFVEGRLLRMFPLEDERRFLPFQKALVYFDQIDLVPHVAAPLIAAERIAVDVPVRTSEAEFRRGCVEKIETESRSCAAFRVRFDSAESFCTLALEDQTAWLRLWATSQFTVKRDFARTARSLIFASAYSADRLWPAIGYEGPLLAGPERST